MYQHPRQQTAYICSDRARLLYQGVIPKYLVRYADDWVILTNSEQEAHRFLHWLQKYFTHRLKIELSEEKTVITDMRQAPVNFLGFSFKVRQTAYQPDKPRREIAMSYPNPQKLQKAIRKLCDGVKAVRTCSNDSYRAVQIETVNAQIVGIAEHYKHVLCSEAYHKIDYAVNKCAYKVFKRIYGKSVKDHVIPLENLSNRPTRHAGHKDTALAMQIHGQWIGFTKAYLTHAAHGGHSFHQKITPYTAEGRELYRRKAKKSAPKDRPPLYDGTNLLELSAKKPIYNFEYYMNREYAFNRDKGKCRCCHINLNPGHYHCHHINPKLPINQINKVQNLAWVCENCHKAIHGKAAPSYAVGQVKDKIERFQKQLAGQKSLFANGITFILFGFYTVYSSLFLALGKGAAGFFLGACRQGICFVPVILLLPMVWGMNGILYAQPIADVISVVITVFMALHLHKELSESERRAFSEKAQ